MNILKQSIKLQIVLSGAKTSVDCPVTGTWRDESPGQAFGGVAVPLKDSFRATTNGVTAVDLVPAPGDASVKRIIAALSLFNKDTGPITLALQEIDASGATSVTSIVYQITLQTLENLYYTEAAGWEVQDANGATKSQNAATSSATSTAQATASAASVSISSLALAVNPASVNSVSSQASSLAAAIVPASVNSVSSQASSIAAAIVPASINSVSSQASSITALAPQTISSQASLGAIVSSLQSAASVQSFTSTNWSTISSATSRVKSSFAW